MRIPIYPTLLATPLFMVSLGIADPFTDNFDAGNLNSWSAVGQRGWSESSGLIQPADGSNSSGFLLRQGSFASDGNLDAPKNTVQTFTTSLWNINGNGAFIPVHRLMFQALRAGPVDDCVIQSIQFQ